jgi:hypothetical protein
VLLIIMGLNNTMFSFNVFHSKFYIIIYIYIFKTQKLLLIIKSMKILQMLTVIRYVVLCCT